MSKSCVTVQQVGVTMLIRVCLILALYSLHQTHSKVSNADAVHICVLALPHNGPHVSTAAAQFEADLADDRVSAIASFSSWLVLAAASAARLLA